VQVAPPPLPLLVVVALGLSLSAPAAHPTKTSRAARRRITLENSIGLAAPSTPFSWPVWPHDATSEARRCAMQTHSPSLSMVRAEQIPARSDRSEAQTLHFPSSLMRDLEAVSQSIGHSIHWCLAAAWRIAESTDDELLSYTGDRRMLRGPKEAVRVELSLSTWRHLTAEAEHLDRSKSWLLQRAWLLARDHIHV